jgi:hypothetical protein
MNIVRETASGAKNNLTSVNSYLQDNFTSLSAAESTEKIKDSFTRLNMDDFQENIRELRNFAVKNLCSAYESGKEEAENLSSPDSTDCVSAAIPLAASGIIAPEILMTDAALTVALVSAAALNDSAENPEINGCEKSNNSLQSGQTTPTPESVSPEEQNMGLFENLEHLFGASSEEFYISK